MANKTVKLDIVVSTTSIQRATRTATEASRSMADKWLRDQARMTAAVEKENNKRQRMYEKLFNDQAKLSEKAAATEAKNQDRITRDAAKAANERARNEKKAAAEVERAEKKVQSEKVKEANKAAAAIRKIERETVSRGQNRLQGMGLLSQAMGSSSTGYLMRMAGVMGIGSKQVGSMDGVSLAGVGVALGGIAIASKLVSVGFEALSSVVTSTAGAFMGAVSTIGGAKSLQQNIEDAATNEAQTTAARMMVAPEERASAEQINNMANGLSKRSDMGGFTSAQWREGIAQYGETTGLQKSLVSDPSALEFAGKMAMASKDSKGNSDPAKVLKLMGILQSQNPDMKQTDIQNILLNGMGKGLKGSFSMASLIENPDLLAETSKVGGSDKSKPYADVFGLATNLKKRTGSLPQATTEITAIIRALNLSHKKGTDFGTFKGGMIQDLNESVIAAASMDPDKLPKAFNRTEADAAIKNVRSQAGVQDTDTSKQAEAKIRAMFEETAKATVTMEEFNTMAKESEGVFEKFRASFNGVNDSISNAFKPSLDGIAKALDTASAGISSDIQSHQAEITQTINLMITTFLELVPTLVTVTKLFLWLGEGLADKFAWLVKAGAAIDYDNQQGQQSQLYRDINADASKLKNPNLSPEERKSIQADMKEKNAAFQASTTRTNDDIHVADAMDALPKKMNEVMAGLDTVLENTKTLAAKVLQDMPQGSPGAPAVSTTSPLGQGH